MHPSGISAAQKIIHVNQETKSWRRKKVKGENPSKAVEKAVDTINVEFLIIKW